MFPALKVAGNSHHDISKFLPRKKGIEFGVLVVGVEGVSEELPDAGEVVGCHGEAGGLLTIA